MFARGRLLAAAVVFGLVAVGLTVREGWYFFAWPEVAATVSNARVHEESSGGQDAHPLYRPDITVTYSLNGRLQQGQSLSTYWSNDRSQAEAIVERFPPRTRATMRYDPSDPTELRFDAEPTLDAFKVPLFAAAASIVFGLAWFVTRRNAALRRGIL